MGKRIRYRIWCAAFAAFQAIAFVPAFDRTAAFWVAYGFTVIAFALQPLIWAGALRNRGSSEERIFGMPLNIIGALYLLLQAAAFLLTCVTASPVWIPLIAGLLMIGIMLAMLLLLEL